MQIIPAIDIIDGKCVRLTKGDFARSKVYNDDPVQVAKMFEEAGFSRLHMVDLDGAKAGSIKNLKVLEAVAGKTKLVIDFGGGVKNQSDVGAVLNAGASIVSIGSFAARHPAILEEWLMEFGSRHFLIGADTLNETIRINGWQDDAGISLLGFIGSMLAIGVTEIFCTDISKDGMMQGPSTALYGKIREAFPDLSLIASGGVNSMEDLHALQEIGCTGAIVGKAIYEGSISVNELVKAAGC